MADLNQMFSALQKADAAGNVEDARQIADMIRQFQRSPAPQPEFQPIPEDPGFFRALKTGVTTPIQSALPAAKLMLSPGDEAAAEQLRQVSQTAQDAYRRTEFSEIGELAKSGDIGGALGATWSKFKELAGESIGFQAPAAAAGLAARVGVGAAAAAAGVAAAPAAAIGVGAYGLTLLGQYIASNIGRQVEENKGKPVERLDATVAGVGSTVLDIAGGKFLGLTKLLGLEGKKAAEQSIEQLVKAAQKQGIAKTAGIGAVKGIGFEVPQEVAQSVLERWQAGLPTNPFDDPGAAKEYAEAAAGALMLGGPLGAVGQVGARSRERGEAVSELQRRGEEEEAAQAQQAERNRVLAKREARAAARAVPEQPTLYGTPEGELLQTPEALAAREAFAQRQFEAENLQREQPELFRSQVPAAQPEQVVEAARPPFALTSEPQQRMPQQMELPLGQVDEGVAPKQRDLFAPYALKVDDDLLTDLGFSKTSKKARDALRGLDLTKATDLERFDEITQDLSGKVKFNPDAVGAVIQQAQESLAVQKTRSVRPQLLGGEAMPDQTAVELMFAQQRANEGLPLTPRQQYLLRNQPTPEIITPTAPAAQPLEVVTPPERKPGGQFLTPTDIPKPLQEPVAAVQPEEAQKRRRSKSMPTRQMGLDFEGAPDDTGRQVGRAGVVPPVSQPEAGVGPVGGVEPAGVAGAERDVGRPAERERAEQPALEAPGEAKLRDEVVSLLKSLNVSQAEAEQFIKDNTDAVTGIDMDAVEQLVYDLTQKLRLTTKPVGAKLTKAGAEAVQAGDLRGALKSIADNGSSPFMRFMAKKLLGRVGNVKLRVADIPTAGQYDPATDTITLNPNSLHEHALLHEMVHAAVSHVLRNKFNPTTRAMQEVFDQVRPRIAGEYGAASLQEFASEAQSNPDFRAMLKSIKMEKGPLKTAWDAFVDIVRKMFGATPRGSETALDRIDKLMDDLLSVAKTEPKTPGDILLLDANVSGAAAAYKQVLDGMGRNSRTLPELTNAWVDATGRLGRAAVGLIAKTLDLNHLAEIYGDRVPAIRGMIDRIEERSGYTKTQIDKSARIARQVGAVLDKYEGRPELERFADVVYDSTRALYDPSNPNASSRKDSPKGPDIQHMYDNLPKDLRESYVTLKDHYAEIYKDYIAALEKDLAILPPEEVALIKKDIEGRIKPYFPLARFGDFWLQFERDGSRYVMAFETPEERERFIASERIDTKADGFKRYKNLEELVAGRLPPSDPMIQRTLKTLRENNVDKAVVDDVYRALLKMHPQQSAILNMIKRENVPGFSRDVLRSYTNMVPKLISQTASRMYNKDIEFMAGLARSQLADISSASPKGFDALADEVAEQLSGADNSRLQAIINPKFSTLAAGFNWLTFTYFLGANVSTALINLTQTPMVAYPLMASEFGSGKAFSELLSAYKAYGKMAYKNVGENVSKYGYLSPLHAIKDGHPLKPLYDELQKRGHIAFSLQQELQDMQNKPTALQGKAAKAANLAITFAYQHSEMANREITAIAAYNLGMAKFKDKQKAINYAIDVIKKAHGSGMMETAGPIFQHPLGRTVLIFKRFAQLMLFRTARVAYQSIANNPNLSPAEREQAKSLARKQLFGIAAMAFAFAGAQGMPFFGLVEFMYDVFHAAFGDDDEYSDFKNWARNTLGEFAYKGPFVYATGADISSRTGFGDMLIRDDSRTKAELGALRYYFEQFFLGAPFSILTGVNRGAEMIGEGQWYRGLETMSPIAARNGMKAVRFWNEGARTLKGDPITDDIGAMEALYQLGGFAPAKLTDIYEKRGFMKEMEIFIRNRKRSLLDQYELAQDAGDFEALNDVQAKINSFNAAYPEVRITSDTIRSSMRERDRREREAIYGVQIDKRVRERIRKAAEGEE